MLLCQQFGHDIIALANLLPASVDVDELDSYMFQTVGHELVSLYSECTGIPLIRRRIIGSSLHQVNLLGGHMSLPEHAKKKYSENGQ
jgi:diphthine-ammonia ligase